MKRLKVGKWYFIRFLDHTIGGETLVTCQVAGYLLSADKEKLKFTTWLVEEEDCREDNQELLCLIRSTILDIVPLEEEFVKALG